MRFQRRGYRQGLRRSIGMKSSAPQIFPEETLSMEAFSGWLFSYLKPKGNSAESVGPYQQQFHAFSPEEQKNLIDRVVNQILYAHSDVVSDVFRKLAKLSLDFSQKAEISYRKRRLLA